MAQLNCSPTSGEFPWPPANAVAMSAFHSSDADIRWDDPSELDTGPTVPAEPTTRAYAVIVPNGLATVDTAATGSLLVVSAPIPAGETIEVDGVILTSVHGVPATPDEWDSSSGDPAVVASNLLTAINEGSVGDWGILTGTQMGSTLNLTAGNTGPDGDLITLASSTAAIVPSGPTMTGGSDGAWLSIGGYILTGTTSRVEGENNWEVSDPGPSLVEAINDPTNSFSRLVTAKWTGSCIYLYAVMDGEGGNGIPLETNSEALVLGQPATQGGSGTPCPPGKDNSRWNIVGVNIYRSDTGERGPYFRVNRVPVQTLFYRDRTDIVEEPSEVIPWNGGWVFRGDSPNNKGWRIRTRHRPMVKRPDDSLGVDYEAVPADSPFDVEVTIDGQRAVVVGVFGPTGEIDISTEQVWDQSTETFIDPPIPTATSSVVVRYYWQKSNKLERSLDRRWKVFYRLTTVAVDPTGQSPTGLVETPLGFSPPVSPMESEKLDYIWREAVKRNRWILEQGGERVKLFIRRAVGVPCDCMWDARLREWAKQPLNMCLRCYGTGWKGGYEGPYDLIIGPDDADRNVMQTINGRRLEHSYEVWIGPSPMVSQRDFIVKQNGERYSIGPVRRTQVRGVVLQQAFTIGHLPSSDIRYRVPVSRLQLERLPWPETRYTNPEDAPCEDVDPYPIGCDPQATPMATEVARIPDGREQRGRTPVWANLTYGGGNKKP